MICCVTGHRPDGFPFRYEEISRQKYDYMNEIKKCAEQLIYEGYTQFISGMAKGVDLDFAEAILYYKKSDVGLKIPLTLEAALPFPKAEKKKNDEEETRYQNILFECDIKTVVCQKYQKNCFQLRNEYMVDKSDLVFAVWNGIKKGGTWNTIRYAQKLGKPIRFLMLDEI